MVLDYYGLMIIFRYGSLKKRIMTIVKQWKYSSFDDAYVSPVITPCRGLLLYGPSGCGKSFICKAIASQPGLNFLQINM